jgi:hypothetical protein
MTIAGKTAQPLQPAAPFARWSAVLAAGLGCLALQDTADPDVTTLDLGETVQQALEPAHLSLWTAEMTS